MNQGLISCLLVALPVASRFHGFKESIECFRRQSYRSRELVVVLDIGPFRDAYRDLLWSVRKDVRLVLPEDKLCLGRLRNLSLDHARGEFVCQWDDDDLHHPQRLQTQLRALREGDADAVFLEDVLQFFPGSRELYWTNWRNTDFGGHQATLFTRRQVRARYPETGENCETNEDEAFRCQLERCCRVRYLRNQAQLYVYVSHGSNTMSQEHHQRVALSLALRKGQIARRRGILADAARLLELGDRPIRVMAREGLAFTLTMPRKQRVRSVR